MSRVPTLVVLGSTGTGKSRLGIELAKKYSGEIISADSMQVYRGLDIITAKVTHEEQLMVPHHMIDIVDPLVNYCVTDYRLKALSIMNELLTRRVMPVIVGGTNYYIEALLWKILVDDPDVSVKKKEDNNSTQFLNDERENENDCDNEDGVMITDELSNSCKEVFKKKVPWVSRCDDPTESNESLHQRLTVIDPEMARRLHPNNRRKVMRSLEVYQNHGTTHSEILKAQRCEGGGSSLGGPLRFPDSVIIWLHCDQAVLDDRLEKRVDAMLEAGLIHELLDFHQRYNQEWIRTNECPDYTKGIFQSIGFKEFHDYLILPESGKNSKKGEELLKKGIEDLKMVTKRYARRQQRWIMNRFIRRADRQVPPVYQLDCTNVDDWDEKVLQPAIEIVDAIRDSKVPHYTPKNENITNEKKTDSSNEEAHWCEVCERVLIGHLQWVSHKDGSKHKRTALKKKRLESASKEVSLTSCS